VQVEQYLLLSRLMIEIARDEVNRPSAICPVPSAVLERMP
jgi:hypothetical protein